MQSSFRIESTDVKYDLDLLAENEFTVTSSPFNYTVNFVDETTLKGQLASLKQQNARKHFIFIDNVVARLYGKGLLKGHPLYEILVKETSKSMPVMTKLLDRLLKGNFTKKEIFVSVGGGITQDVSSFGRAVYKRGINWHYFPTTLLSMGDSCIGAKACLNYSNVKNLLGLFSAPRKVLIYPGFLKTLSNRDLLSGYGEIIKLAIIGGKDSIDRFDSIRRGQNGNLLKDVDSMIKLSLLVKKSVIEIDEFEHDIRRALNYGHTVGHAIEPLARYKIPHGIAISIGMMMENLIAAEFGTLPVHEAEHMNSLIRPFVDQQSLKLLGRVSVKEVFKNMQKDKKALSDGIYMAVPFRMNYFDMLKVGADKTFERFLSDTFAKFATK